MGIEAEALPTGVVARVREGRLTVVVLADVTLNVVLVLVPMATAVPASRNISTVTLYEMVPAELTTGRL